MWISVFLCTVFSLGASLACDLQYMRDNCNKLMVTESKNPSTKETCMAYLKFKECIEHAGYATCSQAQKSTVQYVNTYDTTCRAHMCKLNQITSTCPAKEQAIERESNDLLKCRAFLQYKSCLQAGGYGFCADHDVAGYKQKVKTWQTKCRGGDGKCMLLGLDFCLTYRNEWQGTSDGNRKCNYYRQYLNCIEGANYDKCPGDVRELLDSVKDDELQATCGCAVLKGSFFLLVLALIFSNLPGKQT